MTTAPGTPDHPKPQDEQMLRSYLAMRDEPCPACGYNLRQLQTNICPECGNQLRLAVNLVGGINVKWITALVAALLAGGIGLPFHVALLIAVGYGESIASIAREPEGFIFLVLAAYAFVCLIVSIVLLVKRRKFLKLSPNQQQAIATLIVALDVFAAFVALALIRSALN